MLPNTQRLDQNSGCPCSLPIQPCYSLPPPNGNSILSNGNNILSNGNNILPNGNNILSNGNSILSNGNVNIGNGITRATVSGSSHTGVNRCMMNVKVKGGKVKTEKTQVVHQLSPLHGNRLLHSGLSFLGYKANVNLGRSSS